MANFTCSGHNSPQAATFRSVSYRSALQRAISSPVTRMLNSAVNERLQIQKKQRGKVPRQDMEEALHDLDAVGDTVREALKEAL